MNCNNPDISEADYMEVIYRKTAKLFEAGDAARRRSWPVRRRAEQSLVSYGRHLGHAFQLVDDALDYDAEPEEFGKNIGDDLAEGKPTLPLIYAMAHGSCRGTAHDSRSHRDGRHAEPHVDSARDRNVGRPALHGRARRAGSSSTPFAALATAAALEVPRRTRPVSPTSPSCAASRARRRARDPGASAEAVRRQIRLLSSLDGLEAARAARRRRRLILRFPLAHMACRRPLLRARSRSMSSHARARPRRTTCSSSCGKSPRGS